MRLRLLQMFCEVARSGSFLAAAHALQASQAIVAKAMRQLEDDVGTPLIDRNTTPLQLTAAGEIVYHHAVSILDEELHTAHSLDDLRQLRRDELRLGLPRLGSAGLFAPLFAIYRERHPLIDIRLQEHDSHRLQALLLAGDVELAATLLPTASSERIEAQAVCREPLMAVLPADHPLVLQPEIRLRYLNETPFIFFDGDPALNEQLRQACMQQGFEPIESARSSQVDFIMALVAAGQGVAFLPRLMTYHRPPRQIRFVPVAASDNMVWDLALTWRRGARLSRAAQAWLALTREKIALDA
ncbi:MAG: HTH-type transcriptional regulator CynR [Paracidovorax wautersii]|uniref:HTH-type transcriptional regulator CynR n=1 Tax=Paracidovorax wautersii TaxID=1177982 RepID=A0A7V8FLS5_9BURK|nr:MAG: HTH-type transcriptional regulator CynR [Paracidovorax wautersii]